MKQSKQKEWYDTMLSWPKCQLEDFIVTMNEKAQALMAHNETLRADPIGALRKMKETQLQSALEGYGKVDLSAVPYEQIPMIFSRLQADEAAARKDIANLSASSGAENDLKKQLDIAKKVLAEKTSTGGRV